MEIAISDLGQGIRSSLSAVHGRAAGSTSGYIRRALGGLSARGHTAQGLNRLRTIAVTYGGALSIRSSDGCVTATAAGLRRRDGLAAFPGTQIAVTFRGRREPAPAGAAPVGAVRHRAPVL